MRGVFLYFLFWGSLVPGMRKYVGICPPNLGNEEVISNMCSKSRFYCNFLHYLNTLRRFNVHDPNPHLDTAQIAINRWANVG